MLHRRWLKCSASNLCTGGKLPQGRVEAYDCSGSHVLDGVLWPLFGFDTWSSKRCCMRPSTRSIEMKSGTCASLSWSKISGSPAKLLQFETSVKPSISFESSGEGVVTSTDCEIVRTLGNRHVCPAYSMTITVRLSGVVILYP